MSSTHAPGTARVRGIAPQFLVDDLDAAIEHYVARFGFTLDFRYEDFYAGVSRGESQVHLKCAPKTRDDRTLRKLNDHLDAYIVVENVTVLFEELTTRGARVISPLQDRPWSCREFWVMDGDGYILAFSEPTP